MALPPLLGGYVPCIDRGGCRAPQPHVEFPFTLSQFNYNPTSGDLWCRMLKATRLRCLNGTESFAIWKRRRLFKFGGAYGHCGERESQQQRDVTVHEHWQLSETKSIAGSCKGRRIQPIALVWKVADKQYVAGTRHAGGLRSS